MNDDPLELSDEELTTRLTRRNVDADMAELLVLAARGGDRDSIDTLNEILH